MNTQLFQDYAQLKIQEKQLKEQIDSLKEEVIKEMQGADLDKQPTELGTFTIQSSKKWTFTKEVESAQKEVERLKKHEQANGKATFTEVPELKFFHIKSSE